MQLLPARRGAARGRPQARAMRQPCHGLAEGGPGEPRAGPGMRRMILQSAGKPYDLPVAECLFCVIVAGEIPATTVLETDRVLAFRDINPQAPTHVLVITKEHYPDVAALAAADSGLLGEVITAAHRVAEADGVSKTGYRVVFNTGAQAGQTVLHVHGHVLGGRP